MLTKFARAALALSLLPLPSIAAAQSAERPICTGSALTRSNNFRVEGVESVNTPALNQQSEAEIGEVMLTAQTARTYPHHVILAKPIEYRGNDKRGAFTIKIPAGVITAESSDTIASNYISHIGSIQYDKDTAPNTKLKIGITIPSANPNATTVFHWNGRNSLSQFPVSDLGLIAVTCLEPDPSYLRRELIYSGVSQGTVTISYREIERGMLRPAFSQELKFDLSEGAEVGFRGARLRILDASNTGVRYEVLKPLE